MSHPIATRFVCVVALAGATVASAAPPPALIPIEDASSAALAIMATDGVAGSTLRTLDSMTNSARLLVLNTMGWFNAATTPDAVVAARRGLSVPCPQGGQVWAFVPKPVTGTVRLKWTGCTYQNGSQPTQVDGVGEIKVPAASFAPEYLEDLRLGSADGDLVTTSTVAGGPGVSEQIFNLHVAGRLPLTRFRSIGLFSGSYDVRIDGKADNHYSSPGIPGDEENTRYDSVYYQHADGVRLIGSATHSENDTVLDEQVNFKAGTFRQIGMGTHAAIPETNWPSITGQDFRVSRTLRAREGIAMATMQGRVRETRNPFSTCGDGWFAYRTLTPLLIYDAFGNGADDAGTVIVNRARISYVKSEGPAGPSYYTPRPGERPTLVTVNMANGTTFELKSYLISATASEYRVCPAE